MSNLHHLLRRIGRGTAATVAMFAVISTCGATFASMPGQGPSELLESEYLSAYVQAYGKDAKKVALVIGNGRYAHLSPLQNSPRDAQLVTKQLKLLNFDVTMVVDADVAQMRRALVDFAPKSSAADVALFFYAGHAIEANGQNLMFGIDARLEGGNADNAESLTQMALSAQSLLSVLEQSAPIRIVILDACRDNPLEANKTPSPPSGSGSRQTMPATANDRGVVPVKKGLAAMRGRSGTYIAYAAEPGKVALDGQGENSPFSTAIAKHLPKVGLTVEQIFNEVRRDVYLSTSGMQLPWSESALLGSLFLQAPPVAITNVLPAALVPAEQRAHVKDGELAKLVGDQTFQISGQLRAEARLNGDIIAFANGAESEDVLRRGVNYITMGDKTVPAWYERKQLVLFPRAYQKSYAIVAAVGRYKEPAKSRFEDLPFMVDQAKKLADVLVDLGFPAENIVRLYDGDVTSGRLEQELRRFWPGGDRSDADRLLFYFGGHGGDVDIPNYMTFAKDQKSKRGLLITHDHDPARPLATSFLLDDIIQRHFAFLAPRHVLFLIDSCSSGLAMPRTADGSDTDRETIRRYQLLALLDSELKSHARNMLVASSGDAKALYQNGGLFTKKLLEGIETRAADINGDGLIQFAELEIFVSNLVKVESKALGLEQSPSPFRVGSNFVFVLPPTKPAH